MLPILFTIGRFNVYSFGFFLALSFLLSTFIVWKFAKEDLKETEYFDAFLYTNIVVLAFARIFYIITHFSDFDFNPLRLIVVREAPGLSLLGGLIGGAVFLFFYARRKKYDFLHLADLFSLAFSFALIFAKIGEQLGGAGYGRETRFFLGVKVVGLTGIRHPTELYEALLYILLSIILLVLYKKSVRRKIPSGVVSYLFVILTCFIFFGLEFLKERSVYWSILSERQIGSVLIFLLISIPVLRKIIIAKWLSKKKKNI